MKRVLPALIEFLKKYRYETLAFFIVFVPRAIYSVLVYAHAGNHGFISYSDAEIFLRQARNLVEYGVASRYEELVFLSDPLRTPLYIWFLAELLLLKVPLLGMATVQNILAALGGALVYRIGATHFAAPRAGMIAAFLFAVEPMSIYWNNLLMSDNLFAFLTIVAVYLLLGQRWYWSAAALGLATLVRPIGLHYVPVFLLGMAAIVAPTFSLRLSATVIQVAKKAALFLLVFAVVVFPWVLHNKIVFARWGLSTAGWYNLYLFSLTEFAARKGMVLPLPSPPESYPPGPLAEREYNYRIGFDGAGFYKKHSKDLFFRYPFEYLAFHISSGLRGMNNHDYYYLRDHVLKPELPQVSWDTARFAIWFGQGAWVFSFLFMFIGLFLGGNRRMRSFVLALILFNALLIGYNGVILGGGRYHLAFVPFVFLLGALGVMESYGWVQRRAAVQT